MEELWAKKLPFCSWCPEPNACPEPTLEVCWGMSWALEWIGWLGTVGTFISRWCEPSSICIAACVLSPHINLRMLYGHVQAIALSHEDRKKGPSSLYKETKLSQKLASLSPNSNHPGKRGCGDLRAENAKSKVNKANISGRSGQTEERMCLRQKCQATKQRDSWH